MVGTFSFDDDLVVSRDSIPWTIFSTGEVYADLINDASQLSAQTMPCIVGGTTEEVNNAFGPG